MSPGGAEDLAALGWSEDSRLAEDVAALRQTFPCDGGNHFLTQEPHAGRAIAAAFGGGPEYRVRMAVDESGKNDAAHFDDVSGLVGSLRAGTDPGDALAVDEDRRIAQHFDLGHLAPASSTRRTTTGDHLARADEQRLQSRFSLMGRRM